MILFNIRMIATYAYQAVSLGYSMEQEMMRFFYNTLVMIGMKDCGMAVLTPVVIETGKMYLKCVELLELQEKRKPYRYCWMVWNDWNTEDMIPQELQLYRWMATCR